MLHKRLKLQCVQNSASSKCNQADTNKIKWFDNFKLNQIAKKNNFLIMLLLWMKPSFTLIDVFNRHSVRIKFLKTKRFAKS